MTTEAATFQRCIRRPNYLGRFRYFIERSDWDDVILAQEECINRMCIGVIVVTVLYFITPVMTILFLR